MIIQEFARQNTVRKHRILRIQYDLWHSAYQLLTEFGEDLKRATEVR